MIRHMREPRSRHRALPVVAAFVALLLLGGCGKDSGALMVDRASAVSDLASETTWTRNGEEVTPDEIRFSKNTPITGSQTFTVERDASVLLSTPDATELPRGVDLSWEMMRGEVAVARGAVQSLLVQPVVVELNPGSYTVKISAEATYEYRNAPRGTAPEQMVIPRIYVEDAAR